MNRFAVIGLGNIADRHRANLRKLYPGCFIYAMSSSGRKPTDPVPNCDALAESTDELVKTGIRFAIVASPSPFHAQHAIPLIRANIPVLIEKPVATAIQDANAIIEATSQSGSPVAVGYCLRYMPSAVRVHDLLSKGQAGRLYNVKIEAGQYLPDWRPGKDYLSSVSANKHLGGGVLLELSHELDYAQWLLGNISPCFAVLRSSAELGLDVEDIADVVAMTDDATIVSIHLDFLQRRPYRRCRFIGSEASIEWDLVDNSIFLSGAPDGRYLYRDTAWDRNNMYLDMIRDFERMISGKDHSCITPSEARSTVKLIEKIREMSSLGSGIL